MIHRIASLLSSLAVAVLALAMTALVWRAGLVDTSHGPTRALGDHSCCFAPAPPAPSACECIA